jgi:hypothetical protein
MGNDDENRSAILARRARYIAMAVAGISTATSATACACLSPSVDVGHPVDAQAEDAGTPHDAGSDTR